MLPKGWIDGRVGDLIQGLESGVSVNGEDRALKGTEKGVLKVSAVSYGRFDPNAVKAIISNSELKRAKTHPRKGQIVISRSNTEELVGASAYVEEDYLDLFLPDKLWQIEPEQNVCMKWLSYILASDHSRYVLSNLATGTSGSMKNITKGEFLGLKIAIPPLAEQRKIAKILGTWDKAIATTEKLIEVSKQQKKALMQQLLTGKKRFSGFEEEWEIEALSSLLERIIDYRGQSVPKANKGIPLITAKNVRMGYLDFASQEYIDENSFDSWMKRGTPQAGDILFTTEAPLGMACRYPETGVYGVGQRTVTLRVNQKINSDFLLYFLLSEKGQRLIDLRSSGSTAKGIKSSELKKVKIFFPSDLNEQKKIATVLSSADSELEHLQTKLANLKQEKKSLMQQLLTGKRRVKVETQEAA
ncbi:restriction endonuclease subunit S [Endozoicomonas sp. ALD040]|uniref:restriction endonuclease subunit S n=1 Tax=Endozoicomonas sp. ALD040 TaxID=3403079 RepID=UPI003BAFF5AD